MDRTIPLVFLRLKGPLQSWGERAKWNHRDTAFMPTKSAIVGLIACAMGLPRNSPKIAQVSRNLDLAIRADKPGVLLTDYHTVTGLIKTADGGQRGKKDEESTLVSHRQYLQDASFLVALSGDENLLNEIVSALNNPCWATYLGRKGCVPTVPIITEINREYTSLDDAMRLYPLDAEVGFQSKSILYEIGSDTGTYLRSDEITEMPGRLFKLRRVELKSV